MKLFSKCEGTIPSHKAFIIKHRTYNVPGVGKIYSKGELCRSCYRKIKKMLPTSEESK